VLRKGQKEYINEIIYYCTALNELNLFANIGGKVWTEKKKH
jgi:hypothetical protein